MDIGPKRVIAVLVFSATVIFAQDMQAAARKIIDFELKGVALHREARIFDGVHRIDVAIVDPVAG